MRLHTYHLEVAAENYIPPDVLIEHLAVAMRDFHFLGKNSIALKGTDTIHVKEPKVARNHPFEGPEVFDDYVPGTHKPVAPTGEVVFTKADIERMGGKEALDKLTEIAHRADGECHGGTHAEGGFVPPGTPLSFEGKLPEDPFPLTTRVIDKLKETRRHGND